ncbi:hypothetical protein OG21DRAFT_1508568 [Imleria badia]|nr:hypothetical protein OG21DRAFT_1508568 [Imleria badia]
MDSNTAGLPFAGSNGQKLFGIVHQEHLSTSVEMHAVLQLTEITEVMCEFLDRPTLARLARTCRAFQEPALDALWKVLLGLEPLARLLPDSMWISEEDPAGSGSRYKLLQPLSPQQWRLIQKYTSRISVISSYYTMTSSDNRLQAIALHWPPAFEPFPPLFPKLKAIRGAYPGRDNVLLFHWLNGPSLTELEIRSLLGDLASQTLIDFVSDMGTIYPNIKIFTHNAILDKERPETMIRGLSKTIRSWKHLEHVDLHTLDLDTAAYEHLMRLESLTSLTLMLASEVLPRLRQAVLPRKPFPALTDLTLVDRDYHIPWMTVEWLNCLHLSPSSLSCRTRRSSADPRQITDLCRAIAAQLCHKSLETILLMDYGNSTSVEVDSIRPLFSFSRLRCVTLANLCTTSLSDDDLLDLATSWPLLQAMSLNYYVNTQTRGVVMPTLEGFCHLLLHCPRLHKLTIVIDARDAEWVEVACPWDDVRNHPMNYLCLGNSFLDDAKRVASILSTLRSLKEVDTTCWDVYPLMGIPERETLSPLWEEVNHHLVELRDC